LPAGKIFFIILTSLRKEGYNPCFEFQHLGVPISKTDPKTYTWCAWEWCTRKARNTSIAIDLCETSSTTSHRIWV